MIESVDQQETRILAEGEERAKRIRATVQDSAEQWRLIQEVMTWVEANLPPERRRNRPRVRKS